MKKRTRKINKTEILSFINSKRLLKQKGANHSEFRMVRPPSGNYDKLSDLLGPERKMQAKEENEPISKDNFCIFEEKNRKVCPDIFLDKIFLIKDEPGQIEFWAFLG